MILLRYASRVLIFYLRVFICVYRGNRQESSRNRGRRTNQFESARRAIDEGANGYFIKLIAIETMIGKLHSELEKQVHPDDISCLSTMRSLWNTESGEKMVIVSG